MGMCSTLWLVGHLVSVHTGPIPNNDNFGAGARCENRYVDVQAGYYRNSIERPTTYLGMGKEYGSPNLKAGWFAGLATGYYMKVSPIPGLTASATFGKFKLQVMAIPPTPKNVGVFHLTAHLALFSSDSK